MLSVRLLGAVSAERDGRPISIASPKQRLLLAVLASARGAVSRERLVDVLWPEDPPPSALSTLMAYVSRLRAVLGAGALLSEPAGYRLVADHIDADAFESLVRSQPPSTEALEDALALWRGEAFAELACHPHLLAEATRLDLLRREARVRLAAAYLEQGTAARPISILQEVVSDEPLREDAWTLLVRALVLADRSAEAVLAANRACRVLAEVGLDPGPALTEAQARALQSRTTGGPAGEARLADVGPVRYARNGAAHLAYQTVGSGAVDVVLSSYGSISIDAVWDDERYRDFVLRLASTSRVVLYDTRGIGLSDPIDVAHPPTLDEQSEDVHRVLEAAHASRAVVVGVGDGGPTAITYAHRHRATLRGLVLVNTFARLVQADDYPQGVPADRFDAGLAMTVDPDSQRDTTDVLRNHAPSVAADAGFRAWWERSGRRGASPATAAALWRVRYGADVRPLLSELVTPTLVLHRRDALVVPYVHGAYLSEHIPGARLVGLDGADQPPFTHDGTRVAGLIAAFAAQVVSGGDSRRR